MRVRRGLLLAGALLLLVVAGCSDDDRSSGGTTTSAASDRWTVQELAGRPAALAVDGDDVLVVDDANGSFVRLSAGRAVIGTVGGQLVGVAPAGGTDAWVIEATGTATPVGALGGPSGSPVDLGGTLVDVVVVGDAVYVADIERGVVHELDATTGAARRQLAVPDGVVRLAADGTRLWVTGTDHTVTPVDLTTGEAGPSIEVGNGPIGVTVADGTVWVTNGDDATVSRLDAATGERRGPDVGVGSGPVSIAVRGDDVWVLAQDAGTVTHLLASSGARTEPDIPIPAGMTRARDLVVTEAGVWVVGIDAPQAALLPTP